MGRRAVRHDPRHAAALLGLMLLGLAVTRGDTAADDRQRPQPHAALEMMARSDGSFPSGHATHGAAFALGLWLLVAVFWAGVASALERKEKTA